MGKVYIKRKVTEPEVVLDNFLRLAKAVNSNGDSASVVVDISDTSTVVGWSSFTSKKIIYEKRGNILNLFFHISGTSNSSVASFTLPSLTGASLLPEQWEEIRIINNGSLAIGYVKMEANSNVIQLYRTFSEASWGNTGTKSCIGTVMILINS